MVIAAKDTDSTEPSTPDAMSIPAADGYHYGDKHRWGQDDQRDLVDQLRQVEETLKSSQ